MNYRDPESKKLSFSTFKSSFLNNKLIERICPTHITNVSFSKNITISYSKILVQKSLFTHSFFNTYTTDSNFDVLNLLRKIKTEIIKVNS